MLKENELDPINYDFNDIKEMNPGRITEHLMRYKYLKFNENGKNRNEVNPNEMNKVNWYFQEETLFLLAQVVIEDVPEPWNDAVVVVESAVILGVFAEILKIDWFFVISNQSLHLQTTAKQ